jgi:hypothetical protein
MFWRCKVGLNIGAAGFIAAITANLVRTMAQYAAALFYGSLLIVIFVVAGMVTHYWRIYAKVPAGGAANGQSPTE